MIETRPTVTLMNRAGTGIGVTDRGVFDASPSRLRWGTKEWELTGLAGPWPVDERWWDSCNASTGPTARAQVVLDDERALLLVFDEGRWRVEGIYE